MTEIDAKYLRDKRIADLLETIAADIVVKRPANPELYLKERFSVQAEEVFKPSEPAVLYTRTLDPLCSVALMAAAFSRVPLQHIEVGGNAVIPKDFNTISPFGRVPAVDHCGMAVLECGPVVRYLCSQTTALPSALRERVKVDTAFCVIENNLLSEAAAAVNERVFAPKNSGRAVDVVALQSIATRFRASLSYLQSTPSLFSDSQWIVGKQATVADFALAAAVFAMMNVAGYDCLTGLEKITTWWEMVKAEKFFVEGMRDFIVEAAKIHTR